MPCGVLSVCSLLLFWIPSDSEEKITLGVTILLAFFVNSLIVSNYTPEATSELPVIGVYYTFNIFLVSLSLAGAVFVLRLHFRKPTNSNHRVPDLIRYLFNIEKLNELECNEIKLYSFKINNEINNQKKMKRSQMLLDLLNNDLKRSKEKELKRQKLELILIECKELSKKVENIFLILNFLSVIILPQILFFKYLFRDLSADTSLQENCSCNEF